MLRISATAVMVALLGVHPPHAAEPGTGTKAGIKPPDMSPEKPNPAKWPKELHVDGREVLDADGKPVWLQGVHIVSLDYSAQGEYVLRSTQVAVDDWKSNVIRLAVRDDFWFGEKPGQKDGGKAYRDLVDAVINVAANRGAYVVLDLHRFRAPNETHVKFWKEAAEKYRNHPAVLFEIFNEAHGVSWDIWRNGGFVEEKKKAADEDAFLSGTDKKKNEQGFHSPGMQALVNAVREIGAKNIVIAGGLDWAYDLSGIVSGYALDDNGGNGIIYCTHIYNWKKDWQGKVMGAAGKHPHFRRRSRVRYEENAFPAR